MNDRFKFRGITKGEVNKFVYGSLLWYAGEPQIWDKDGKNYIVKPETIQQCTGFKDKNGKLIYELDYVRYSNNKYKVEVDKFLGISLTNILNGDTIVMDNIVLLNCEVIGNEFESNTKI